MVSTLFTSPEFVLTESSFIIVASIAAYELLVGDFIWAQQEQARRSRRGYVDSRQLQHDRGQQGQQHRSLSPATRGAGARSAPGSRRASANEETPLLYPPRSSARGLGGNRDARVTEEGYSSPGDIRYAGHGRGSSGDSTRRLVRHDSDSYS